MEDAQWHEIYDIAEALYAALVPHPDITRPNVLMGQ